MIAWLLAFLLFLLSGAAVTVFGVYLIAGAGWALIVSGALLFAASAVSYRAMFNA